MSDIFTENKKFICLNGILGRRDFIVNILIVEVIEALLWTTPMMYAIILNPDMLSVFQSNAKPVWLLVCICLLSIVSSSLYFPSIVRRVRDITAIEDKNKVYLISATCTTAILLGYLSLLRPGFSFLPGLGTFILLILIFLEGKITSEKPKSEIIKFNWGAFFGTWFWGLFNKSPITFLMIPLIFTTGWVPFTLICGLKGNEWSYEKKKDKYKTIEDFHISQQEQATIFTIFTPILTISLFAAVFAGIGSTIFKYADKNPNFEKKVLNVFKKYQIKATDNAFSKIENVDGQYKFYIDPNDWTSGYIQVTALKNAANYVLIKENNYEEAIQGNPIKEYEVKNRIKIYSTFNNEILAECNIKQEDMDEMAKLLKQEEDSNDDKIASEIQKIHERISGSCKYNQNPTLP